MPALAAARDPSTAPVPWTASALSILRAVSTTPVAAAVPVPAATATADPPILMPAPVPPPVPHGSPIGITAVTVLSVTKIPA
ncbi:hypothetical protein GGF32_005036 [Allomyces javanicus]|nr:hypothetical protein GGF32_005036 [Allomyces javanicus]